MVDGGEYPHVGAGTGMKFLADMGISPKTVDFLRNLGHDAVHLHDRGLDRLPDPAVLVLQPYLSERHVICTARSHNIGLLAAVLPHRRRFHSLWAGRRELTEVVVLGGAVNEQPVLLIHDLDFGELMAASGARLPSVIIFRLRNMQSRRVNYCLHGIIAHHRDELDQGAIISVTEGQIRVRLLP